MKKLRLLIEEIGLSYKREMLFLLIINLVFLCLSIALFIVLKNYIYLLVILSLDMIFDIVYIYRYSILKNKMIANREKEFVSLITYFRIFISNGSNVYNAFERINAFSSLWMKEKIDTLLIEIDDDKTVLPFINLARNFKPMIIEQVLVSIYQMVDEGTNSSYLVQFNSLFSKFSDQSYLSLLEKKKKKIGTINAFPLIGAGIITMILAVGIIGIVGKIVGGV